MRRAAAGEARQVDLAAHPQGFECTQKNVASLIGHPENPCMAWRRELFSTTGRSLLYGVAGAALFGFVVVGFISAWGDARRPPAREAIPERRSQVEQPDRPDRHVPPLPVTYPFY